MSDDVKVSRGYWSIKEVVDRLKPLADWYAQFKPGVSSIVTHGSDYDLIARWPKAAAQHQLEVSDAGIVFKGFTLKRDSAPARYEKGAT